MTKIIKIIIRIDDENRYSLGVVRNNNYMEVEEKNIDSIKKHIDEIKIFAENVKTKEEKELEEKEKENQKLLSVVMDKTNESERIDLVNIMPRWEVYTEYKAKDERVYNKVLYVCRQDHKSSYETIPLNAPTLWRKAEKERIRPDDYNSEKKYKINEKCYWAFNKHVYLSLINQEGQSPFSSPQTWEDEGEW